MKVERMKSKKSPIKIESRHKSLREFIGREKWEYSWSENWEWEEEKERKKRNFSISKNKFQQIQTVKKLFLKIENLNAKQK